MARITIEDCLSQGVMNQFELVLLAAKRARRLANGADALVEWQNDKPTVVALREIAEGKVNRDLLLEAEIGQYRARPDLGVAGQQPNRISDQVRVRQPGKRDSRWQRRTRKESIFAYPTGLLAEDAAQPR